MGQRIVARVALEVSLDLGAQGLVDSAGLRQRVLYQGHRERPLEYRLIREDEDALNLPFHFRLEIQRQIAADACAQGGARGRDNQAGSRNSELRTVPQ